MKEAPGDERVSAPMQYLRYSPRKRVGKPETPVRKGGVVHSDEGELERRLFYSGSREVG